MGIQLKIHEQAIKLKAGHYVYKDFDIIWNDAGSDNDFISKWTVNTPTFQLVKTTETKKEAFEFVDNYMVDALSKGSHLNQTDLVQLYMRINNEK
jgi:hypothetical protein